MEDRAKDANPIISLAIWSPIGGRRGAVQISNIGRSSQPWDLHKASARKRGPKNNEDLARDARFAQEPLLPILYECVM
jgi:hypothetical protein